MAIVMARGDTRLIIDACKKAGLLRNQCAYVLATAWHETAKSMKPVRETLAKTDAGAKAALTKAWKAGKLSWVKADYWSGGYYGRGYPQVTHQENYARASKVVGVDLVAKPDRMMESPIAIAVMLDGMVKGWFRKGHTLARYITLRKSDFVGAREIINGDKNKKPKGSKQTMGEIIAGYAKEYDAALKAEGYGVEAKKPAKKPSTPVPSPRPIDAGMTPVERKAFYERIQTQLRDLGYTEVGEIDGDPGRLFATAVRAFRAENGLPEGDQVDDDFLLALQKAPSRKLAPERAGAPVEKVAQKAPEVAANWRTEFAAKYGFLGTIIVFVFDWIAKQFDAGQEAMEKLIATLAAIPAIVWFALAALVLGYLWFNHWSGRVAGVLAWRSGARR